MTAEEILAKQIGDNLRFIQTWKDVNSDRITVRQALNAMKDYARLMIEKDRERVKEHIEELCFDLDIEAVINKTQIILT